MPIEVEDIQQISPKNEEIATNSEEIPLEIPLDVPVNVASEAAPKRRGRPPGSKNKPKPAKAPPPVQTQRRSRVVIQESGSESECCHRL